MSQLALALLAPEVPAAGSVTHRYQARPRIHAEITCQHIDGAWHYGLDIQLSLRGEGWAPAPKWKRNEPTLELCMEEAEQELLDKLVIIGNGCNTEDANRALCSRLAGMVRAGLYTEAVVP